jgi:hypothetical protein
MLQFSLEHAFLTSHGEAHRLHAMLQTARAIEPFGNWAIPQRPRYDLCAATPSSVSAAAPVTPLPRGPKPARSATRAAYRGVNAPDSAVS